MKKRARRYPPFALTLVVLSLFTLPAFAFQMMRGTVRTQTTGPSVTKITPKRTRTVHKATVKSLLAVKRITISPVHPRVGDKVAVYVRVVNNGPKEVKKVKVNIYLGKKLVAWQIYDISARGKEVYVGYFTKTQAPKAGTYTISALVDPSRTLERTFYTCNRATQRITIHPPSVKMNKRTVNRDKLTAKPKARHATARSGRVEGKKTASSYHKTRSPAHHSVAIPSGKIAHVAVTVREHGRNGITKTRQSRGTLHIRWSRTGLLPGRVDIFLHPYRRSGKGLCLKRNIPNNGHALLTVPDRIKMGGYVVRIQTRNGAVHGDSNVFSLAPKTSVKTYVPPKAVTASRHPQRGGVAATPISIPRPLKVSPREKRHIPHAVTYDFPPAFRITVPRNGSIWLNNKPYKIKWTQLGSSFSIKSITLRNTLKKDTVVDTIFPANTSVVDKNSAKWTIPSSIGTGNYFIRLEIAETMNQKTTLHNADSDVFKILNFSSLLTVAGVYTKDVPIITYFDYDKTTTKGSMLNIKFYWEDSKKNLYNGLWTLETKKIGGTKWRKKTGRISELPNPGTFLDTQGLCTAKIYLGTPAQTFPPTSFRFFLTDTAGLTSNVITGEVNLPELRILQAHQSGIRFLTPPAYTQNSEIWRLMHPFKPGETINVQLELDIPSSTNRVSITFELLNVTPQGVPPHVATFTTTVKTGGGSRHKMLHTFSWKIPAKLNGNFVFKATSTKLGKPAVSTPFLITQNPKKLKRLYIISPRANSEVQIGHQVTIQWQANGFDPSATANIIFFSHEENNSEIKLNKRPVPIADHAWNWNVAPGTVLPGKGYLYLRFSKTASVARISLRKPIVVVDPHHYAPSFTITSPASGQTAHWLTGTNVSIGWKAHNFEAHVIFFLRKISQIGDHTGHQLHEIGLTWVDQAKNSTQKTALTLPPNLSPGPYQLIAWNTKYGKRIDNQYWELAGGRRLVEIINPGRDSLPASGTTFKIHKVVYSAAENKIIVSVGYNAPAPFRLGCEGGPGGTQSVSYRLSNYELFYPDHKDTIASGGISVKDNASIFPTGVLGPGLGVYILRFSPKPFGQKLRSITVRRNKNIVYGTQSGSFPDQYSTCQYFYPKLELFVTTFLSNGKVFTTKRYITYVENVPEMLHKTEKLETNNPLWATFTCQTQW